MKISIFCLILELLKSNSIDGYANFNEYSIKKPRSHANFNNMYEKEQYYDTNLIKTRSIHSENNACQLHIECSG